MEPQKRFCHHNRRITEKFDSFSDMVVSLRDIFDEICPDEYKNLAQIHFSADDDMTTFFTVTYYRPETPEEFQARVTAYNQIREHQKEARRQTYLKLKQEFENE